MPARPIGENLPKLKSDSILVEKDGTWKSSITAPIKKYKCIVPIKLLHTMREIERWCTNNDLSGMEFGLYLKGELDKENQQIVVSDCDFMVPIQKVSAGSIDFEQTPNDDSYNGVIHRHPGAMHSFSGTDETYINSNFEFSLLYAAKEIKTGIANLPTEYGRIRIDLEVEVDHPSINVSDLPLENIKKAYAPPAPGTYRGTQYQGKNQNNGQHLGGYQGKFVNGKFVPANKPAAQTPASPVVPGGGRPIVPFLDDLLGDDDADELAIRDLDEGMTDAELAKHLREEYGIDDPFSDEYDPMQDDSDIEDDELASLVDDVDSVSRVLADHNDDMFNIGKLPVWPGMD